jgi:voltage-gated potassium channel
MRRRIFDIIEKSNNNDKLSHVYDIFMIFVIVLSLVPLAFKEVPPAFVIIDRVTVAIFIVDYLLRWITADFKLSKGTRSFILYPVSVWAIIDLLSILPSILMFSAALKTLKVFRLIRALRVFKAFKTFRYSKNIEIIIDVFRKQRRSLTAVIFLAVGYIFISALIIFNVEPETFNTFFDAVYWATVSLTTVGYGDIYTVSVTGKIITMISSILGIAIVALPAGVITAGYMNEIQKEDENE